MMFKLAAKNIKRSFSDFWVYFVTVALGISIFYIFNSIKDVDKVLPLMNWQRRSLKSVGEIIYVISFFITGVMAFLMIYANDFLLKRRAKELGTYLLLGMENRNIAELIFSETLLIGICACIAGIVFGIFISQTIVLFVIRFFHIREVVFQFFISKNGILFSLIAFVTMFILVLIWNVIRSYRFRIIGLMRISQKNERLINVGKVWEVIIFFIGLCILGYGYYLIHRSGFAVFFGTDFSESILFGTIGTILVFRGLASAFLRTAKHFSGYYKNLNLFFFRQISKNIRRVYFSMAIISILILFGMGSLIAGSAVGMELKRFKKSSTSFDLSLKASFSEKEERKEEDIPSLTQVLKKEGINLEKEVKGYMELRQFVEEERLNHDVFPFLKEAPTKFGVSKFTQVGNLNVNVIPYSDYVKAQGLKGEEVLPLKEGEVLILSEMQSAVKRIKLQIGQRITLFDKSYSIAHVQSAAMQNGMEANDIYYILQDGQVKGKNVSKRVLNINYLKPEDEEKFIYLPESDEKWDEEKNNQVICNKLTKASSAEYISTISKQLILQGQTSDEFLMMVITGFIGLIFIFFTAALLAMQQLSMQEEDLKAYGVLQTLGASEKQLRGVLFRQIGFYFLIPLIVGIIHTAFGIHAFMETIVVTMGASLQSGIQAALSMGGIVCAIYALYFVVTYIMIRRRIENIQ